MHLTGEFEKEVLLVRDIGNTMSAISKQNAVDMSQRDVGMDRFNDEKKTLINQNNLLFTTLHTEFDDLAMLMGTKTDQVTELHERIKSFQARSK